MIAELFAYLCVSLRKTDDQTTVPAAGVVAGTVLLRTEAVESISRCSTIRKNGDLQ